MLGLLLVFKVPIFGHCLPFLGYNNGKKDPNTCFPIYVESSRVHCRCHMANEYLLGQ